MVRAAVPLVAVARAVPGVAATRALPPHAGPPPTHPPAAAAVVAAAPLLLQGTLRGFDQATNLILDECHERVYSSKVWACSVCRVRAEAAEWGWCRALQLGLLDAAPWRLPFPFSEHLQS